jgi:membrane-bound inhibitor of C-type lysozyme
MIVFNKVTWYSRLLALILFLLILPALAFYIGMQYERFLALSEDMAQESYAVGKLTSALASWQKIAEAHYLCDAGRTIDAVYYEGPKQPAAAEGEMPHPSGKVSVSLDGGDALVLMQTISGSGIRYATADESLVFWSKGEEALIMRENVMDPAYTNCKAVE